jgi:hypothetical protein
MLLRFISVCEPPLHYVIIVQHDNGHTYVYHFRNESQLLGRVLSDRGRNDVPQDVPKAILKVFNL